MEQKTEIFYNQNKQKKEANEFVSITFSFMLYRKDLHGKVVCLKVLFLCHKLILERKKNPKEVSKNNVYVIIEESTTVLEKIPSTTF